MVINILFSLSGILTVFFVNYSNFKSFWQFISYSLPSLSITCFSIIMIIIVNVKQNKRLLFCFINIILLIVMLGTLKDINLIPMYIIPILTCPLYIIYLFFEHFE